MTTEKGASGANGVWIGAGVGLVVVLAILGFLAGKEITQEPQVAEQADAVSAPEATSTTEPETEVANGAEPEPAALDDTAQAPEVSEESGDEAPTAPIAPAFDVVRVDPEGRAVIAGHAAPGAKVQVLLDDEPLETLEADSRGNFVSLLDLEVSEPGQLSLQGVDSDGEVIASAISEGTVLIQPVARPEPVAPTAAEAVDESAPAAPTAPADVATGDEVEDSAPTGAKILLADNEGITVLQDAAGDLSVQNIVIDSISYDETGEVALSGRGQGGADVRVYLNNKPVRTSSIAENGQWRLPLTDVESGVYTLRVDELAADGSVSSRAETPFKREEPADVVAAANARGTTQSGRVEAVTVQPGFTLWAIARDNLGEGILYVRVFEANKDKIRDPDLIYPGQVFEIPEPQ